MKTNRNRPWQSVFRQNVISGGALIPNAAVYSRYSTKLERLIRKMASETRSEIELLFRNETATEYFAQDKSISAAAKVLINALETKFDKLFSLSAKPAASEMAEGINNASQSNISQSLKEVSEGLSLKTDFLTDKLGETLNATIAENVGLIKSIPSQYLDSVRGAVMRSITTGNGLQDLVPFLAKQEGMTLRRARNIALDQTRKLYGNVNKIRLQKIGVKKFEWIHSAGGQHPRREHIEMSGNIYSFENLPIIDSRTGERGIPGQAINCRCVMRPIIEFDDGGDNAV